MLSNWILHYNTTVHHERLLLTNSLSGHQNLKKKKKKHMIILQMQIQVNLPSDNSTNTSQCTTLVWMNNWKPSNFKTIRSKLILRSYNKPNIDVFFQKKCFWSIPSAMTREPKLEAYPKTGIEPLSIQCKYFDFCHLYKIINGLTPSYLRYKHHMYCTHGETE